MSRAAVLVVLTLVASSLSPPLLLAEPAASDFALGSPADLELGSGRLYSEGPSPEASSLTPSSSLSGLSGLGSLALGAEEGGGGSSTYLVARGGPLFFLGDLEDLGTGWNIEGAVGIQPIRFLAIEIQSGYFWGEDSNGSDEAEIWGIPLLANVKLCIPILFLEIYGGLGAGGYYIKSDEDTPAGEDDDGDVVFGGNAFVGVDLSLGPLFVGVEGKYILTADVDAPVSSDFNLEGFAAMAVVGLRL